MDERDQQQIRELAFEIWQKEGCPVGRDVEHWLSAEAIWKSTHPPVQPEIKPKKTARRSKGRKTSILETQES